jgi:hypothetical protein
MRVEKDNTYSKDEAKKRIDGLIEKFIGQSFPGVSISNVEKSWSGDQMNFSFKGKKGFISTSIKGFIEVTEEKITLDTEIPRAVKAFVREDELKTIVQQKMDEYL